jgi:hypothetical protein
LFISSVGEIEANGDASAAVARSGVATDAGLSDEYDQAQAATASASAPAT